jgi:putative hemolysin
LTLLLLWAGSWAALQECPADDEALGGQGVAVSGHQ